MAKAKRRQKTKSFDSFVKAELRDPELAAEYLSSAVEERSLEGFLLALKHGGIGELSKLTKLNRQSMYRMFSSRGNPTVSSLFTVLDALGLEVSVTPQGRRAA